MKYSIIFTIIMSTTSFILALMIKNYIAAMGWLTATLLGIVVLREINKQD